MGVGSNSENGRFRRRCSRRIHALVGVVSSINLLVLIGSGMLLQHSSLLRLDEKTVSRAVLPKSYRPQDGDAGVRADIFVTDVHSGRLLGTTGTVAVDMITVGWLALLLTGMVMYFGKRQTQQKVAEKDSDSEED